ncbi:MAG: hypothetical protein HYR56_34755 [Acidobacteria bacterium]|nr:hypothetical protein [Acidobacteriota bacterium]MBI3422459.1 hypothetical protein [Acidobacteriota bacterium]
MQQTCSKCGAVAAVPSKFCRNCGAPLPEATATEAPTRQYGRQTPAADVPPTSSPFAGPYTAPGQPPSPSVADAFTPDTTRLQNQSAVPPGGQPYGQAYGQQYGQPPMPAAYPSGNPVPYPLQPPPKSNWWKWVLGFVLTSLLVCGGLLGYAFKRASNAVPQVQKQIEAAIAEAQKEADRAARESGNTPNGIPPPPPPAPGQGTLQSFDQLRYPKAEEINRTEAFGQHVLTMKTSDNVDTVKAYYEKKFGRAPIESKEQGRKSVVFIHKPYMVTVGNNAEDAGQTTITLIQSSFIPQVNPQQ